MAKYNVGIDLGGTKIYTAISDDGRVKEFVKIPTEADRGFDVVFNNIVNSIYMVIKKANLSIDDLANVGIAVPGPVNYSEGLVYDCPNIDGWKNIPIREFLEKKINKPVFVENDARAAALAEAKFGAGRDHVNFVYITISTGIGGGIIINREIYRGADGAAGETGRMRNSDGSIFELTAAGPAIYKEFGIKPEDIKEKIEAGDKKAIDAFEKITDRIAIVLGNITTLLNPEIFVVGGGVSNIGALFIETIEKKTKANAFSISGKRVLIKKAALGGESGVLGAIAIVGTDYKNFK